MSTLSCQLWMDEYDPTLIATVLPCNHKLCHYCLLKNMAQSVIVVLKCPCGCFKILFLLYNIIFLLLLSICDAFFVWNNNNNIAFGRTSHNNGQINFSSSLLSLSSSTGQLDFCYKRLGLSGREPYVKNKSMSAVEIAEEIKNKLRNLIHQKKTPRTSLTSRV